MQSEKDYQNLLSFSDSKEKTISSYEVMLKKKDEELIEKNNEL